MSRLSKEEKSELLRLAGSKELREDFRRMKNKKQISAIADESLIDNYIMFLTVTNSFANHTRKPFKKMTGDHFIL